MAFQAIVRSFGVPSTKRTRTLISFLYAPVVAASFRPLLTVSVTTNYVTRTGGRQKTLRIGILLATVKNPNVLLYRKLQPSPHLAFPVFTPWKRRVKSLGQIVAPIIPVGGGGAGIDLQHYLGLSLMKLGGLKF